MLLAYPPEWDALTSLTMDTHRGPGATSGMRRDMGEWGVGKWGVSEWGVSEWGVGWCWSEDGVRASNAERVYL